MINVAPGGATESFRDLSNVPAGPAASGGIWTLERCLRRALTANRGLLDSEAALATADFSLLSADSAFLVQIQPTADLFIDDTGQRSTGIDVALSQLLRTGTVIEFVPSTQRTSEGFTTGYTATLTQPLLRGRQRALVESGVDRARFSIRTAERSRYLAQVDVALSTIRAVYRIVQARETLQLSIESAARSRGHLVAAQARQRAGLSTSLDVFRATQQAGRSQDALDTQTQAYGDAKDALKILLALPLEVELDVVAPLEIETEILGEDEAVALALGTRVELRQAEDSASEARRLVRVAGINVQPDLDLALTVSQFGADDAFGQSLGLGDAFFGLSLGTSNDFRRIPQKAAFEQAKIAADAAQRSFARRRDVIVQEVKRSLRAVERGRRSIQVQRGQIDQAEGKLLVARKKFELGLTTNRDVVEAEEELRSAEATLIASVANTVTAQFALRASLGTLLETPGSESGARPATGFEPVEPREIAPRAGRMRPGDGA